MSDEEPRGRRRNRDRGEPQLPLREATDEIVVYRDDAREWRWRYVAANRRKMANGGEGYKNHGDLVDALKQLFAPNQIVDRAGRPVLFKWFISTGGVGRRLPILWEDTP